MADFLELSGIRKEFGEFVALKGVSLGVKQGEAYKIKAFSFQ